MLIALPLGLFLTSRSTAVVSHLLIGSSLFSLENTSVLLGWLGHGSDPDVGPCPDGFPAEPATSEVIGYGLVRAVTTLMGVGLVLLGARLRARRESRHSVVAVS